MDADAEAFVTFGDMKIPLIPYRGIEQVFPLDDENTIWLVFGYQNDITEAWKMAKFVMTHGIERKRILNFGMPFFLHRAWIGNLRFYVEQIL